MANKISLEKCKYYFNWNENGELFWKNDRGSNKVKDCLAGYLGYKEYYRVSVEGKLYLLHRILYQLYNDVELNDEFVDHKDGNPSNNSKENLRIATISENCTNRKVSKNNKITGFKNIYITKTIWYDYFHIQIRKDGKNVFSKYLRTDKFTLEEVIKIRNQKLLEIHGEFMNKG